MAVSTGGDVDASELAGELERVRRRTLDLLAPYDDEVLARQHDPIMSPLVWDLAHVANYEDIWLVRALGGEASSDGLDDLYDAFRQPRGVRSTLPLLSSVEAARYGEQVRARTLDRLESADLAPDSADPLLRRGFVHAMVVQHEHQHDETMLAAISLLPPAEGHVRTAPPAPPSQAGPSTSEVLVPAGDFEMGNDEPWAYDNERPRHVAHLPAYWIDAAPVTNSRYRSFVEDGGYGDARWWLPEGWAWRREAGLVAPQHWRHDGAGWVRQRFGQVEALPDSEPVQHVCWYEADAYARWAGRRLPTEAEWEKAAAWDPLSGASRRWPWGDHDPGPADGLANLGQAHLGPAPVGAYPAGVSPLGCHQMVGDVWEWTASTFQPYPGFAAFPYREYSEVFWGDTYRVLRGGSWATDPAACRTTFRNWDLPIRRQIFAGFRCARDA